MITENELKEFGFEPEMAEEARMAAHQFTGYPLPLQRYWVQVENYSMAIEEPYFWVLEYLQHMGGYPHIVKITDVFSAAENSSFFGANQQRLGLQQDKVSQFLATIGKMVKELFQLVRELRVLDERLGYYKDSYDNQSKSRASAEITLKGIWVDMVEQGAKNPASVYGMAREVQFTTLPDLFFNTHPLKQEDVDVVVDRDRSQFNNKVKEVLKRKLRSFLAWKEHTFDELANRRIFTLKYLRQHYEVIRMYMMWVKPYLKNIERLHLEPGRNDTVDMVTAFERSFIEIEMLAKSPVGKTNDCILVTFNYFTRPEMNYHQEYNRGPIHVGKVSVKFRGYSWTDEEIENYQKMRAREDFKLLGIVDNSVKAAMESLGDELERYLQEAGEEFSERKEQVDEKIASYQRPYGLSLKGVKDLFMRPVKKQLKSKEDWDLQKDHAKAEEKVRSKMWRIYAHFKKHHGMLSW